MMDEQDGCAIIGSDPEGGLMALDGQALNEVSGGIPDILVGSISPALGLGAVVDGVITGIKGAVDAVLTITEIF
jgi:hypothetical protein